MGQMKINIRKTLFSFCIIHARGWPTTCLQHILFVHCTVVEMKYIIIYSTLNRPSMVYLIFCSEWMRCKYACLPLILIYNLSKFVFMFFSKQLPINICENTWFCLITKVFRTNAMITQIPNYYKKLTKNIIIFE